MPVLFTQTMPDGVTIDLLDAVTAEMGVESDPPPGMIVHVHFEEAGRCKIIDVWASAQDHATFVEGRLMPAMGKVAAERGFDLAALGEPEMTITEVHAMVRGA